MPWVHGDDYKKQKNAELRHLLCLRRLPFSGTKQKMVSRLVIHDKLHPFPFQKLPPELRNEIYKLVSIRQSSRFSRGRSLPIPGHCEGPACFAGFENVMVHSGLFRTCKQMFAEGLAIFYQHHVFMLYVEHAGCFLAILAWLRNIGNIGRTNIRELHIRFKAKCILDDCIWLRCIHAKLSDQATMVCITKVAGSLWKIGQIMSMENSKHAPVFRINGLNKVILRYAKRKYMDYSDPPDWAQLAQFSSRLKYSMTFSPGEGWFGACAWERLRG